MMALLLYGFTGLAVLVSACRDRRKTLSGLQKAWRSFEKLLPLLCAVLIIIGLTLAFLSPSQISHLIGRQSGLLGLLLAAVIGSVTVIPGFITFPLASCLLKAGASITTVTVFVSTSMMVGVATIPVEINYIGRKATLIRNGLAIVCSLIIAMIMWWVLR